MMRGQEDFGAPTYRTPAPNKEAAQRLGRNKYQAPACPEGHVFRYTRSDQCVGCRAKYRRGMRNKKEGIGGSLKVAIDHRREQLETESYFEDI